MSPETINASHVFRVGSVNAIETIYELSSCSVSVNEHGFELSASNPVYELSFRPVSVSRPIFFFFFFFFFYQQFFFYFFTHNTTEYPK